MLFVGVAVLLLAAVFFFKYAFDKGWISETVRVLMGAAVGFVMIGLGEWALIKRKLQLFAAGIMGGGVVLLYFVVFVASPNGWYHLIGAPLAFGLMCVVTALGMALSVQTRMLSSARSRCCCWASSSSTPASRRTWIDSTNPRPRAFSSSSARPRLCFGRALSTPYP
jgi:hypothetical protein